MRPRTGGLPCCWHWYWLVASQRLKAAWRRWYHSSGAFLFGQPWWHPGRDAGEWRFAVVDFPAGTRWRLLPAVGVALGVVALVNVSEVTDRLARLVGTEGLGLSGRISIWQTAWLCGGQLAARRWPGWQRRGLPPR